MIKDIIKQSFREIKWRMHKCAFIFGQRETCL